MILGLDVSTSITGYTILDTNGDLVEYGSIDTRKHKNFFIKVGVVEEKLSSLKQSYAVQAVYIEQSLQSFRSGFSSAQTLSTLSRFNGVVSWLCFKLFNLEPEYFAAVTARRICGIKVPRGTKAKPVVLQFVLDNEPQFVVEYTNKGNPRPDSYDKADSWVIAKSGYDTWQQKNKKS
jgi:Holliday junction resolvasome RuvABC endonuclease subunit|tara:strand:- start:11 stop:541 length:531 start_codon:yes stop_codon:yes gene_type:complete